jgi:hypothetical protein
MSAVSALPPKADTKEEGGRVRFGPTIASRTATNSGKFSGQFCDATRSARMSISLQSRWSEKPLRRRGRTERDRHWLTASESFSSLPVTAGQERRLAPRRTGSASSDSNSIQELRVVTSLARIPAAPSRSKWEKAAAARYDAVDVASTCFGNRLRGRSCVRHLLAPRFLDRVTVLSEIVNCHS